VAAGGDRVLTQRELNRALLERQFLLTRRREALPRALERLGGIQAQYAPSMYIGLWSRLAGFERAALTRALERRSVVQATLMRSTIHLVSRDDYWQFAAGTRDARWESWQRGYRRGPTPQAALAAARRVERALARWPRSRAELLDGIDAARFAGASTRLNLVRVPPSGTWERRRADLYARAEDWLGTPPAITPEEGIDHLIRRYLRAFGPASPADVASWAGIAITPLRAALERIELRHFRDEQGGLLVDVPRAPLPPADAPAPARFLPTWDSTLLVNCRRTQILPEDHRPKIFHVKNPQSEMTFLVDGAVAGTWKQEKDRVRLHPFGRLRRDDRDELEAEAERLAAFMVDSPPPATS
jgi:Winged helix DNA-binding domain